MTLALWPPPTSLLASAGSVAVPEQVELTCGNGAEEWAERALDALAYLRARPSGGRPGALGVRVDRDDALAAEEYRLEIGAGGVHIVAASPAGVGHAAATLRQLLPPDAFRQTPVHRGGWTLPQVVIQDAPAFGWRGFMLDVSRYFTPKAEVLRIVEWLAMHRLNRLHLHLTDDQGWRVESALHPRLNEIATWRPATAQGHVLAPETPSDGTPHGGYYTADDLREITAHARRHGIVVVPEVDLPGHASALLAGIPELVTPGSPVPEVRTAFTLSDRVISPLPAAREIVAALLGEVAGIVDSPYFHIGGDEADTADWAASPEVDAYRVERGLADLPALSADLRLFLARTVAGWGRRAVMWDEAFDAGGCTPETVVMSWRGQKPGFDALAAGHDVVMAPVDPTYLDYAEGDPATEPLALGNDQDIARVAGYAPAAPAGSTGRLLGMQAQLWTEYVPDFRTVAYRTFPRLAVHAANAWSGRPTAWPERAHDLDVHLQRLAAAGIEFRPPTGPLPWQRGGTGHRRNTSPITVRLADQYVAAVRSGATPAELERFLERPAG